MLFLGPAKLTPASGPLHLLFPQLILSPMSSQLRCHSLEVVSDHPCEAVPTLSPFYHVSTLYCSFFFFSKKLSIFGCAGSWLLCAGSLIAASRGDSLVRGAGFSSQGTSSRARAQWPWRTGFIAPQPAGSSHTRDPPLVPCTGRWVLNHRPTTSLSCSYSPDSVVKLSC